MGQWLSTRLSQPFITENRSGAGGNIATEAVVRAPANGYTLLLATSQDAVNATLYERLSFNFIRDISPVASIIRQPNVMLVNASFPAKTLPEFFAYAKANPGKVNMASAGIGNPSHMAGELLKMMTGIDMVHVPYRGGAPALTDLLGGQVQVYFGVLASSIEYIRANKLRALAVTSASRSAVLSNLPTLTEFVPGYETSLWLGLGAPRSTPADIIDKLNGEINSALADPSINAKLLEMGGTALPGSPDQFRKLIADETEKWGKVVKFAAIKPE